MPNVLIIGAGLTGSTLAHRMAREGVKSILLERAEVPGGLVRSEHMDGVLYEPHGSHIFHTEDEEVWELANSMTPFRPYRHRVDIVVEGKILNWPILVSDIEAQSRSDEILREQQIISPGGVHPDPNSVGSGGQNRQGNGVTVECAGLPGTAGDHRRGDTMIQHNRRYIRRVFQVQQHTVIGFGLFQRLPIKQQTAVPDDGHTAQ